MGELDYVLDILEQSLKKNGDKPITTRHWINIIKMAQRQRELDEHYSELEACYGDMYDD